LARAGASVVILEKGPYYTIRDFNTDEIATCRRDFWVPWEENDPHTIRKQGAKKAHRTREGWTSQCVGGGTVHMSGFFYRLKDSDFRLHTLTGGIQGADITDWPIGLKELEPFYDLMESRIGVSGKSGINPFEKRKRPYPLPPLRPHPAAALIDKATAELNLHAFPTARAIASVAYGKRAHCTYCGFCGDYGCETGARSTMISTMIPEAEASGRCRILAGCMARRITADSNDCVRSVEYYDPQGKTQRIRARVVVLAATAIESARILILSASGRHPHGLANSSGLVGRNLTFSTFGKGSAIFDRAKLTGQLGPEGMDFPFLLRSIQDDYFNPRFFMPKGGTHNFLLHHPNPINAAARLTMDSKYELWGQALKDRLHRYFHEELMVEFEIFGEFLPHKNCYMDLDPKHKDRWGLPVARITTKHHPLTGDINRQMVRRGLDILEAIKPRAEKVAPWAWANTTYHLQHGTCRFGNDPNTSVLDRNCQSHDIQNLYVTDGSFMPTSGGVPATATILANSFRVAHKLIRRFKRRDIPG
jgi:choline dehydrogenase-like flavoprotein